jgi:RHS repeat-associated protein
LRFDGNGSLTGRYLHGEAVDQIFAEEVGGQTRWTLTDHLGSVRDVVSDTGVTLGRITYDSFGQVTNTTGIVDTLFRYTARPSLASTGLYDYRARAYDPRIGQFLSEDPIAFTANDPNLRRYVGNEPTRYTDPSGLKQSFPMVGRPETGVNGHQIAGTLGAATAGVTGCSPGALAGAMSVLAAQEMLARMLEAMLLRAMEFLRRKGLDGHDAASRAEFYRLYALLTRRVTGWYPGEGSGDVRSAMPWEDPVTGAAIAGGLLRPDGALMQLLWRRVFGGPRENCAPVKPGVSPIRGVSPENYPTVRDVLNGKRPHSDLAALPEAERRAAIDFYRTVEETGVASNPDPVRRQVQVAFNQARADFLERGGTAPGNFNDWVLRSYPATWVRDNLPQVWRAFLEGR